MNALVCKIRGGGGCYQNKLTRVCGCERDLVKIHKIDIFNYVQVNITLYENGKKDNHEPFK